MQIRRRKPNKKILQQQQQKRTRVNEMIRVEEVRVISEDGENLGVMKTRDAIERAKDAELDLVEINPKAEPPICKITNFGKMKYEQEKAEHKKKMQSKKSEIKGIRLSFKIKGGDLDTRVNQAKKFLESGNQVNIEMILKGREKGMSQNAKEVIENFIKELGEEIKIIQPAQRQGGKISATVAPPSTK